MRRLGSPNRMPTSAAQIPASAKLPSMGIHGSAQLEVVGSERADRHEGRGAERELACIAGEDVEAERGEREDQERGQDRLEPVLGGNSRDHDERHEKRGGHGDPILQQRENLLIGRVAGLELPGFAIEHGLYA